MIARVARFRFPSDQHRAEAERNGIGRVGPSLARAPGFHALYYGRTSELEGLSISLFDSREANEAAGAAMNAQPLLAGQVSEMLPTPESVAFLEVLSSVENDTVPLVGRFGHLTLAAGEADDEADRWARESFAPMLSGIAGLCQGYLLRGVGDRERIALTFWEAADAMRRGGESIAAWQEREIGSGRKPAYVGTDASILTDLRVIVAGIAATLPAAR
jgi:heme-degrading monooxygenase HmoA